MLHCAVLPSSLTFTFRLHSYPLLMIYYDLFLYAVQLYMFDTRVYTVRVTRLDIQGMNVFYTLLTKIISFH